MDCWAMMVVVLGTGLFAITVDGCPAFGGRTLRLAAAASADVMDPPPGMPTPMLRPRLPIATTTKRATESLKLFGAYLN